VSFESLLETVRFETGSKLRDIEPLAFYECEYLQRICIRASCEKMTARSLQDSRRILVEIESGGPYVRKTGVFILDLPGHDLVRYCARGTEVTIPEGMLRIGEYYCAQCNAIRSVHLGDLSQLASIGASGFAFCERAKTIVIPASVTFLGEDCCTPLLLP
jgi:hypothetical protein